MSLRRPLFKLPWIAVALACGLAACTDVDIFKPIPPDEVVIYDNKIKLNGRFCTSDPTDVIFPLKVLFIIDTSQSMNINDPMDITEVDPLRLTGRSSAILDVVSQYIDMGLPVDQLPVYCNTGETGCEKGSTQCPTCGAPDTAMCIGPDCCRAWDCPPDYTQYKCCHGTPVCPTVGVGTNGICTRLCDVNTPGCGEGETACPACSPGDKCLSGVCGKHLDPGVEFAIMRFGSAKQVLTKNKDGVEGFTNDPRELVTSMPQVNNGGSVTDYEGALSMAFNLLSRDMASMQKKNASAVSRSKYVIIFLSDGQPDPKISNADDWAAIKDDDLKADLIGATVDLDNPSIENPAAVISQYNIDTRILRRVKEIMGLKIIYHVGGITLHTAYLAGQNPSWLQDLATFLLKQMATIGKGTFRNFQNGEELNFLHVDFSSMRRIFRLKNFIVTNTNAHPINGRITTDSDGDGIDDKLELEAGTNPVSLDTDGDGFSDTLEHFFRGSGWDALDPVDADCSLLANDMDGDGIADDKDGDGLLDCEERFIGTSRDLFDTDADGIPDGTEVRFGTNPVAIDVAEDLDFDGMPNGDEIRLHTDPRSDDAAHRSRGSYRYNVEETGTGIELVGRQCNLADDCPSKADCREGYCRCIEDLSCSSNSPCVEDIECTLPGERCNEGKCSGTWTCRAAFSQMTDKANVCAAKKHITCYTFEVENIALVTPLPIRSGEEEGWNQINLYMGEVPFDNPLDYGNFKIACVRARFLNTNGRKEPSTSRIEIPETAWWDPQDFSRIYTATSTDPGTGGRMICGIGAAGGQVFCNDRDLCIDPATGKCKVSNCVCPDGNVGVCPTPSQN